MAEASCRTILCDHFREKIFTTLPWGMGRETVIFRGRGGGFHLEIFVFAPNPPKINVMHLKLLIIIVDFLSFLLKNPIKTGYS